MLYNCNINVILEMTFYRKCFRRGFSGGKIKIKKMPKSSIDFILKKCKIVLGKYFNKVVSYENKKTNSRNFSIFSNDNVKLKL